MGGHEAVLNDKAAVTGQLLDVGRFAEEKNVIDGGRVQTGRNVDMGARPAQSLDFPQKQPGILDVLQDFTHDDARVRAAAIEELQEIGLLV